MKPYLPFSLLLLSLLAYGSFAQPTPDSARIVYSEEVDSKQPQHSHKRFKVLYNRFIRAQIEEKTLIKLGGLPTNLGSISQNSFMWSFRNEVTVEQKLTPAFSVLISALSYYHHLTKFTDQASVSGVMAGRWYFVMNRRIRQGKSANNFSGQYVTLQLIKPLWASNSLDTPLNGLAYSWTGISLGTQRRLSRFGYLDANIGPGYTIGSLNPMPISIRASFLIGLGL